MLVRVSIAALAAVGAAVTGYLTLAHYDGARLVCPTSGCETVQHSSYALLLGVPVALLGLLAFLGMLAAAAVDTPSARTAGAALALTAFIFSGYLFVVQLAVIHALCTWCVMTDVATTLLLPLTWLRVRATSSAPGAAPWARSDRGSRTAPRRSR
jgi:uncharacterized membrane protein